MAEPCDWFVNNGTVPAWCCNTHMFDGTGELPATGEHPEQCRFGEDDEGQVITYIRVRWSRTEEFETVIEYEGTLEEWEDEDTDSELADLETNENYESTPERDILEFEAVAGPE